MTNPQAKRPPRFMSADALAERVQYVRLYADLAAIFSNPARNPFPNINPRNLLPNAEHGSITGVVLDHAGGSPDLGGNPMIGISLLGEKPRLLHPLDYCAVSIAMAFGLPLTLQKTGSGLAYPRFRAAILDEGEGWNIYLLRVLADAKPWQTVKHLDPLAKLRGETEDQTLDHHYLGRDALALRSIREDWEEGKASRVPRLGRADLITAALAYFDRNSEKAGLPITRDEYAMLIASALQLADWRHGRSDGRSLSWAGHASAA